MGKEAALGMPVNTGNLGRGLEYVEDGITDPGGEKG